MAVYNSDGSVFKLTGSLQRFDPENPEFDLFNIWDKELIEIAGTPIYYYELMVQLNTIDPVYLEDRGKLFSNCPVCLNGYYEPISSQMKMTLFGADSPGQEIMLELNYKDVLDKLGHNPKIGSRIYTPHLRENWYVANRHVESFQMWGELRLQLLLTRFIEDLVIGEGKVTQKQPDFTIDAVRGLSGNSKNKFT
jgi:hypothetical protein